MKLSKYFLPIIKDDPSEAHVISHKLMLRAGMIRQQNSGIYSWLPLGVKVLQNISNIVREEMNKMDAIEIILPCIQPADFWIETGRYESYGQEMLKIKDRHNVDLLFGPTAEDAITDLARNNIKSYKELPMNLYQIQWKFRDEIRPRFGLMRGREFMMKDAYSFDIDQESAEKTYDRVFATYLKIFERIGLKAIPVKAETGPIGGKLSHEFQIVAKNGESEIFYDSKLDDLLNSKEYDISTIKNTYAASDEIHDSKNCPVDSSSLKKARGIEVGHIFNFGTKYSEAMNFTVQGPKGELIHPICGSYGIGVSRFVAAIIEASHDDKGIIWPESVAPYDLAIINLNINNQECAELSERLYAQYDKKLNILLDDTSQSVGSKFATNDLIGTPYQLVIGPKLVKDGKVEIRKRKDASSEIVDIDKIDEFFKTFKA
ncbi:MAG: proline--tRNA ligase [Rickettsiales bacterium]